MLRFHLDENVPPAIAAALIGRGYDVNTATSAGLLEATDEEHLAFAAGERRVVVTHDADFLRFQAVGVDHHGIAHCSPDRSLGDFVRGLVLIAECLSEDEMRNHVEFI